MAISQERIMAIIEAGMSYKRTLELVRGFALSLSNDTDGNRLFEFISKNYPAVLFSEILAVEDKHFDKKTLIKNEKERQRKENIKLRKDAGAFETKRKTGKFDYNSTNKEHANNDGVKSQMWKDLNFSPDDRIEEAAGRIPPSYMSPKTRELFYKRKEMAAAEALIMETFAEKPIEPESTAQIQPAVSAESVQGIVPRFRAEDGAISYVPTDVELNAPINGDELLSMFG